MSADRLRVVLAEDHVVVRRGLAMLIASEPDLEVVAEVGDGLGAVEAARIHRANVVVMDVALPRLDGLTACTRIKLANPATGVVVLTGSESAATFQAALAAGADGYVPKVVPPAELLAAIRAAARGERLLHAPAGAGGAEVAPRPNLTPRELEVLRLMATCHTYRDIAEQLVVSEETVRSHVKSILHKLGQPDRTQAVVAAVRAGLIRLG